MTADITTNVALQVEGKAHPIIYHYEMGPDPFSIAVTARELCKQMKNSAWSLELTPDDESRSVSVKGESGGLPVWHQRAVIGLLVEMYCELLKEME